MTDENNTYETTEDKKDMTLGAKVALAGAGLAAVAGFVALTTDVEDKVLEHESFLETLAGNAPESISRHDLVKAACGPLAGELETIAAEQGMVLDVKTEFQEIGTRCDTYINGKWAKGFDADNLKDRSHAERYIESYRKKHAASAFCSYFNETVIPTLVQTGMSYRLEAELDSSRDCAIRAGEQGDEYLNYIIYVGYEYHFDDDSRLTSEWQERVANDILDNLPLDDRHLIADKLPGLLAGPAPK